MFWAGAMRNIYLAESLGAGQKSAVVNASFEDTEITLKMKSMRYFMSELELRCELTPDRTRQ